MRGIDLIRIGQWPRVRRRGEMDNDGFIAFVNSVINDIGSHVHRILPGAEAYDCVTLNMIITVVLAKPSCAFGVNEHRQFVAETSCSNDAELTPKRRILVRESLHGIAPDE